MKELTVNEVETHVDEHENIEALKIGFLQARATKAQDDIANQDTIDGESFFDEIGK